MKKYFKLLLLIVAAFVVAIGLNANAEVVDGTGYLSIYYPIHKTDEAGKALTGVQFTFSNVGGDYTLTSDELEDGDYLIEYYNEYMPPEEADREELDERKAENKNEWDNVIKFLPSKYQKALENLNSWEDAVDFFNDLYDDGYYGEIYEDNYAYASLLVPAYIEETVAPSGYDKEKIVVIANVHIEINYNGYGYADVYSTTEYDGFDEGIGYFKYDSSVDYEKLLNKFYKEYFDECYDNDDYEYCAKFAAKLLRDNGYLTDVADCSKAKENYDGRRIASAEVSGSLDNYITVGELPGEQMLARFDDDTLNYTCILQIKDSKTIVNPETYGTLIAVLVLAIGSIGLFVARKVKTN